MKFKTTQKAIKAYYRNVIRVGYCRLQTLLTDESPAAYTVCAEGWGAGIYTVGNAAIVTGYKPFGNIRPSYEVCERYEKAAAQITSKWKELKRDDADRQRRELLEKFIEEVTQK